MSSSTAIPVPTTEAIDDDSEGDDNFRKIEMIPLCIIIVVGFFANIIVIWNGTSKRLRFKHYTNYFILSLAFADLGVVMMAIPVNLVEYTVGLHISQFTCAFVITIRETFQCAAMQTVTILGLARLRQITTRSHMPISKRGSMIIVAAIWLNSYLLISLPMGFVYKIYPDGICDPEWPNDVVMKLHLTFTTLMLLLPLIIVTFSYLVILKKIKNLRQGNIGSSNDNNENSEERAMRKGRSLSLLLVMLILTCWISYAPLAIHTILFMYEIAEVPTVAQSVYSVFFYASSMVNPLLVIIMSREYRFRFPRRVGRRCRVGNARNRINANHSMQVDEASVHGKKGEK